MRIGIEAQRIFRPKKHGMDIVVLEVLKQLQEINSSDEFVVFVKDDADAACLSSTPNMQIVKVPGKTYVDWEQWSLPKAVRNAGVELLHCTSNTAPFSVPVPTVVTLHDIIYLEKLQFTGTAYQNFGNVYRRFNVPSIIKRSERVITVSEYEKARIVEHLNLDDDRVQVVYNGLSDSFKVYNEIEVEKARSKRQLPSQFILSLGNQAPKKNMKGSIKAYLDYRKKSESPLPLVLVECTETFLQQTLNEFSAGTEREHIHLTGYIPHAELPLLYNMCSTFLYPSLRESFGIPILEANACGVPVITSNTSSMPEVSGGSTLLTDPFKPEEITQALLHIETDKTLRSTLVSKGLENARKFTWRNTALQTLDIYKEALKLNDYGTRAYSLHQG